MPPKRAIHHSPAPTLARRSRKRQRTQSGPRVRIVAGRDLNSDGDREDGGSETESDYEDQVEHERSHGRRGTGTADDRQRRRSAPAGRATSTRRSSLPTRQSLGGAGPSSRQRIGQSRLRQSRSSGKEDEHAAITQHPARRRGKVLSPLPVNHTAPRTRTASKDKGKGKEREIEPAQPNRARSVSQPVRVTRRTSGSLPEPSTSTSIATFEGARSRRKVPLVESDEEREVEQEEEEEEEDEEMDGDRTIREGDFLGLDEDVDEDDLSEEGDAADAETDDTEWTDASTQDQEEEDGQDEDGVEEKLRSWSAPQLRRLTLAELTELHLVAIQDADPPTTRDELARAIVAARQESRPISRSSRSSRSSLASVSEEDGSEGDDSPRPVTSREGSDEPSSRRRSTGNAARKTTRKKVVLNRKSGSRDQPPTPPHTSDEGDNDGEDEPGAATEPEEATDQSDAPPAASSQRMTRRASQIEMPPPPLPAIRRHTRARSSISNIALPPIEGSPIAPAPIRTAKIGGSPKARNRFLEAVEAAEASPMVFTSPIAHRTRGQDRPAANDLPTTAPFSPRPDRASKRKAVARLGKNDKGKNRATSDDDEDMELDAEEDGDIVLSDGSDSDAGGDFWQGDSSVEFIAPNGAGKREKGASRLRKSALPAGRRRSARTAKQVETPPSDADEESGGEAERELPPDAAEEDGSDLEIEEETTTSHLRREREREREKVVKLQTTRRRVVPDDEEDEVMEDEFPDEEADEQANDGIDLAEETHITLLRFKKDKLLQLYKEHELGGKGTGATKRQLIEALLQWRDKESEPSSPISQASSSGSTVSNLSTQTAREETKTQALAHVEHASARTSASNTPLLMRPDHLASPEKPRTPEHSKEHEQQEDVNALDLESLQLQDKEIQPDKLTKLERIGSGGFKDVYKGLYRKRTIAISDIRGHLTDMDIKELGLLRDLRHANIVTFIGVSIPKQPSSVPVMIITELCANGDLFDYIRKTTPPPFSAMLDIMLGISKGIEYLHTRKPTIIHRDIKSSNVLITATGVAKIADFGLARIKTTTKSMIRSLVGTVNWQAPELWSPHPRYNEKVDVYSVGLVFWEILQWHQAVKRYPFEGQNEHAIYHDVGAKQLRPATGPLRRTWGGDVVDLITEMWDQDPAQRPPMTAVVKRLQQLRAQY
ncbi:hypothetical protein JCM10207_000976 [Rhodosporidiobolus poonsookiae]